MSGKTVAGARHLVQCAVQGVSQVGALSIKAYAEVQLALA